MLSQEYSLLENGKLYSKYFTEKQKTKIVQTLKEKFCKPFDVMSRSQYTELTDKLNQLSACGSDGLAATKEILQLYRIRYHNRSALLQELQAVKI